MKKLLIAILALALCGCSHNGLMLINGKYFGANSSGLHYASGIMLIDGSRENSHFRAEFSDADSLAAGASGNLKGVTAVEKAISHQATGNLKELAEVAPEAVMGYLQSDNGPSPFVGGSAPALSVDQAPSCAQGDKPGESGEAQIGACADGECDAQAQSCAPGDKPGESQPVAILPIWQVKPEQAKAQAFGEGGLLLILYGRSTCSNCKAVFHALQTDAFAAFCGENAIAPAYYLQDATGNDYRFPMDYPEINTPEFLLCRPLNGSGNTYAPGVDVDPVALIPASLADTEAKLEAAIREALAK